MDQTLIGETAAKLMDDIESDEAANDSELIAVGIVVIISNGETTECRTYSTEELHYRAVGLFQEGLNAAMDSDEDNEETEEDEE